MKRIIAFLRRFIAWFKKPKPTETKPDIGEYKSASFIEGPVSFNQLTMPLVLPFHHDWRPRHHKDRNGRRFKSLNSRANKRKAARRAKA